VWNTFLSKKPGVSVASGGSSFLQSCVCTAPLPAYRRGAAGVRSNQGTGDKKRGAPAAPDAQRRNIDTKALEHRNSSVSHETRVVR
jgi:hypothetical protein